MTGTLLSLCRTPHSCNRWPPFKKSTSCMKKLSFYFSILILIVLVGFNSCTIEKRLYQPGYYVDWHIANRKSKTNAEIELKKGQETVCEDKIVVENNVEKIEDFIRPITIQELEPVFTSNDESLNNVEIINLTKQKNSLNYETKENVSEVLVTKNKENVPKSPEICKSKLPVNDLAIAGFGLSILSIIFFTGAMLSDSVVFSIFLFLLPSLNYS
jgi:hypothetical protein